jgi:hypothetical protein
MIPTTSPFEVREEHVIHIHSLCFVKAYLYVVTISSIYVEGFVVLCLMLKYASEKKTQDVLLVDSAEEHLDLELRRYYLQTFLET